MPEETTEQNAPTHFACRSANTMDELYELLNAEDLDDYHLVSAMQLQDGTFAAWLEFDSSYVEDDEVHG